MVQSYILCRVYNSDGGEQQVRSEDDDVVVWVLMRMMWLLGCWRRFSHGMMGCRGVVVDMSRMSSGACPR